MSNDEVVAAYYAAMRLGPNGATALFELFTDDAVYIEPFSDEGPAVGIAAIRDRFRKGWEFPLPDMELDVLEMEVGSSSASARWECRSPGLPGPVRGNDAYELTDGRISRLEVRLDGGDAGDGSDPPSG